jgi:hypothetical protein
MNPNDLFKGPSLNRYLLAALAICGPTLTAMAATGPIISITPGLVSTYAGSLSDGGATGNGGPATSANLYFPSVSRFDSAGNLYILDAGDNVIRKVSASGTISAFAFTGAPGNTGDGGPATAATLGANAAGLFVTSAGVVYVSDTANNAIRMINASGQISTVVGTSGAAGGYTGDGGAPTSATLNSPEGLYVDGAGDIFFADTANNAVRAAISTFWMRATIAYERSRSPPELSPQLWVAAPREPAPPPLAPSTPTPRFYRGLSFPAAVCMSTQKATSSWPIPAWTEFSC